MPLTWTRVDNYCITTGHWEVINGKRTVVGNKWTISIAKVRGEWRYTLWKACGPLGKPGGELIESSEDLEFLKGFAESINEPDPVVPVSTPLSKAQRELLEEEA